MFYRRLALTATLLSALALTACTKQLTLSSFDGSESVNLTVDVADSPKEREKGLMKRESLDEGTGMLFVVPEPQMLTFWMKDTLIPLDVIFFDAEGVFVSAATMEPCTALPCPAYKAAALSQYALEVPKGYREAHKIGTGWKLDLKQVQKMVKPT